VNFFTRIKLSVLNVKQSNFYKLCWDFIKQENETSNPNVFKFSKRSKLIDINNLLIDRDALKVVVIFDKNNFLHLNIFRIRSLNFVKVQNS
jgi:hypothetical protein